MFALVGAFLLAPFAVAQYRFDHWTADNGLPQNTVRDIVQTRDGYLWLTTFDGLVRFDGVRFTVFNKSNSPGILNNRFFRLYEDARGNLWATTDNGLALRLHEGVFTTFTKDTGLPGETLFGLGGDGEGNAVLLVGAQPYRWMDGRFQPMTVSGTSLPAQTKNAHDHARHLPYMAAGRNPVVCFAHGQLLSFPHLDGLDIFNLVPMLDRAGQFWLGSNRGLLQLENGRLKPFEGLSEQLKGQPSVLVQGRLPLQMLTVSREHELWLTDLESRQSHLVSHWPPEGIPGIQQEERDLVTAYGDREGNLWLGTIYNGFYRARKQTITTIGKPQGLPVNEIYPLMQARDGSVWTGTVTDGTVRIQDGVMTQIIGNKPSLNFINSLYQDRAGHIWSNGRWRLEQGNWVNGLPEAPGFAATGDPWTMCEEADGAFWYGGTMGVVRCQNKICTRFTTQEGLAGDDTKVIIEAVGGGIWLGSYGGLTRYQNGRFQRWTDKEGLPGNTVRSLRQEADGTLWIGTYDSGLGRFKDGKFTRYTVNDGLFDSGVFQILEDDFGWLWMSCNRGIYRVRKQELNDFADGKSKAITSVFFGKSDGMTNVECNGGRWPAGFKAKDGKLWFPTMGGIAVIDPASVKANSQPPPVVIEGIKIENKPIAVELMNSALRAPQSPLQIEPQQTNFEIQYTALSFINPENIRFKYKLEGLDTEWIEAGTRRTAYFSHVEPGSYTFKVIAANNDGVWNNDGQSIRIRVLRPFYRTWWFRTLVVLGFIGFVFALFKYRVDQLEQRQAIQQTFSRRLIESQEAERQRIAAELHDSLSQSLVIIKNRALSALQQPVNLERATAQLEEITEASVSAIDEVKEIAYALRPFHLDRLGLTKAMAEMVEKMTEAHGLAAHLELMPLDGLWPPEVEINVYRIVQESLNNIVKHAQATECRVTARRHHQTIELEIADNGRGFTKTDSNAIRNPPSKIQNPKSGFGLLGLAERVRLLGGEWLIQSAPGAGTTITLKFPVPERHTFPSENAHEK